MTLDDALDAARIPLDQRADWHERAAIVEYLAGRTRLDAERITIELLNRKLGIEQIGFPWASQTSNNKSVPKV